ncbi:hypothetical protein TeGR_g1546 [Tetraparma gracilis]|uniref:Ribosomal protein mS38 C-terminal domain-containing protein n=1 Tax=Tetraparma gracilis TaxID=2962635 RepID=A0ABQ6MC07_9STRA|nr:hypothetical protein TeGR_g1546 [Tetraparma gracilis]
MLASFARISLRAPAARAVLQMPTAQPSKHLSSLLLRPASISLRAPVAPPAPFPLSALRPYSLLSCPPAGASPKLAEDQARASSTLKKRRMKIKKHKLKKRRKIARRAENR